MSLKRKQPPTNPPIPSTTPIYTSTPIHDRSSKFLALFSPSQPYLSDPRLLQQHTSLTGSMHRILAWRKPSSQTSLSSKHQIYSTSSDEDGEKWAGKRVEKVLAETGVEGVCVVGRWYGGIMLGPVRFEHIERCAREAIALWKDAGGNEPEVKRAKVEVVDEERVRRQLVQTLSDRDESVHVLRGLLVEKQRSLARVKGGGDGGEGKQSSPVKGVGAYEGMDVARLRTLEKARDATLAWVLKQIEGVEREIESVEKIEEVESGGSGVMAVGGGGSSGSDNKTRNGEGNGDVGDDLT